VIDEDKKVFFIINKFSGGGFSPALEGMIKEACVNHKYAYDLIYTEGHRHATTLAAQAASGGFGRVVAVGGDGTVNEVAQALLNTPVSMGILPKGSGNGLARHLGIPVKMNLALDCLFSSQLITMDTFRLNGMLSLNVSGIGFDGYIADLFGMDKKRGLEGYTRLILNEFADFSEFEAEIAAGEMLTRKNAFVIAIANSSQYGNNARIAPSASVQDGLLNLIVLKKIPAYRLDFIYSFFLGSIGDSAYCETFKVGNAHIQLHAPMYFHVDGEPAGQADHFDIEVLPASLKILAPCNRATF
jgi:YegS/Rv2252/BmrU family lipid kinase